MGLREIRHQVAKLCWRLLVGTAERTPEWNQVREFDRRDTTDVWEKSENGDRPFRASGEVHEQGATPFAPTQPGADIAGNRCLSASEVVKRVLGPNLIAAISNVLVFGTAGSTPLKRMEIRLGDPKEVPATFDLLARALQTSGIDFRTVRNPGIPATEIWLTSPLQDKKKALLSCAAMVGGQLAQRVARKPGSPRSQAE